VATLSSLAATATATDSLRVRQITTIGHPVNGVPVSPIGALDDNLIFIAADAQQSTSIYRTDGQNVALVDSTLAVYSSSFVSFPFDATRLGDELFFTAKGPHGVKLYATEGHKTRLIPDSGSAVSSSTPHGMQLLNGRLVYYAFATEASNPNATSIRLFHTGGSVAEPFPVETSTFAESARLEGSFVFRGTSTDGASTELFSTDGRNLVEILTEGGQPIIKPGLITRSGDFAYFIAGELSDLGLYHTDGGVAKLVSKLSSFSMSNIVHDIFAIGDKAYVTIRNPISNELYVYSTNGDTPSEVLRFPISEFSPPPVKSNNELALFTLQTGNTSKYYEFDGNTLEPYSEDFGVFPLEDGSFRFVPRNRRMSQIVDFQGELFGVDTSVGEFQVGRHELWLAENGEFVRQGKIVANFPGATTPIPKLSFVEFRGQLYFGGINGSDRQLYAVMFVPEPATLVSIAFASLAVAASRSLVGRRK
jgi:hypothetical protein